MKKLMVLVITLAIFATSTVGVSAHSGCTYKTTRSGKGFVTTFYDNGKCCKVYTAKRLKVRIIDSSKLTERRIINRHNKYILVERIKGTCINSKGDGKTTAGYYISYKGVAGHKAGRKYTTYAIYDNTKYSDDVIERFDLRR